MSLPWTDPEPRFREVDVERDVPCRMRDGTVLYADVYRPRGPGPWPVLLLRHPYDKTQAETYTYAHPVFFARYGYMVVVQDCRGRWRSEGEWQPYRHERQDGADTVAWAAGLPGCDGQVAMYGFSYGGTTQLAAALARPPGLRAIMPGNTCPDFYDGWTYRGGALHYAFILSWSLFLAQDTAWRRGDYQRLERLGAALRGLSETAWSPPLQQPLCGDYYREWLEHDSYDDYWQQLSLRPHLDRVEVPGLHIGGWYDIFIEGTLEIFTRLQERRGDHKLVVGPWYHSPWHQRLGALDFGDDARCCTDALMVRWLDRHLKGLPDPIDEEKPVAFFMMGDNRWRFEDRWPPPGYPVAPWYLSSGGRANSLNGNGRLQRTPAQDEVPDVFTYDPRNPVLSLGGHSCCIEGLCPMGPQDQRPQEARNDVLVYTSDPLERDLEVVGPVRLHLQAASTAPDTDFVAKLIDVYPDGRAINLLEGVLRARFRDSLENPSLLEPGRVYGFDILLGSTACVLAAGHRLRVEVTSSLFPTFDRHPGSARRPVEAGPQDWFVATQTVFHDASRPSRLLLPQRWR